MLSGFADVHVKRGIVEGLRHQQMDVVTAQEVDLLEATDETLLAHALATERVMLTNDTDFLVIADQLLSSSTLFAPVFYWPQRGRSIGENIRRILFEAEQWEYSQICSTVVYI